VFVVLGYNQVVLLYHMLRDGGEDYRHLSLESLRSGSEASNKMQNVTVKGAQKHLQQVQVKPALTACDVGFGIFHDEKYPERVSQLKRSWLHATCAPKKSHSVFSAVLSSKSTSNPGYVILANSANAQSAIDSGCNSQSGHASCCETLHFLRHARRDWFPLSSYTPAPREDIQWFVMAKDTTFIWVEHLLSFLSTLNASERILVGGEQFAVFGSKHQTHQLHAAAASPYGPGDRLESERGEWRGLGDNVRFAGGSGVVVVSRSLLAHFEETGETVENMCKQFGVAGVGPEEMGQIAVALTAQLVGADIHVHKGFLGGTLDKGFKADKVQGQVAPIAWEVGGASDMMEKWYYLTHPSPDKSVELQSLSDLDGKSSSLLNISTTLKSFLESSTTVLLSHASHILGATDRVIMVGTPDLTHDASSLLSYLGELEMLQWLGIDVAASYPFSSSVDHHAIKGLASSSRNSPTSSVAYVVHGPTALSPETFRSLVIHPLAPSFSPSTLFFFFPQTLQSHRTTQLSAQWRLNKHFVVSARDNKSATIMHDLWQRTRYSDSTSHSESHALLHSHSDTVQVNVVPDPAWLLYPAVHRLYITLQQASSNRARYRDRTKEALGLHDLEDNDIVYFYTYSPTLRIDLIHKTLASAAHRCGLTCWSDTVQSAMRVQSRRRKDVRDTKSVVENAYRSVLQEVAHIKVAIVDHLHMHQLLVMLQVPHVLLVETDAKVKCISMK
jgi:hypothetical protein